ncbi:MAG TPA: hypothetical protein VFO48_01095, partial [Vicinamibacterales bacterium]|nr:hypothetical protein [Vicinamibacterales bacterium]
MKRYLSTVLVGVACFALGMAFQRYYDSRRTAEPAADTAVAPKPEPVAPAIQFDREPLWAYGF